VRVRPDGTVVEATVRRSSGYAILDEAALEAVRRWVFVPARQGQTAIEAVVTVPIKFELSASR
jgi:protein TonB